MHPQIDIQRRHLLVSAAITAALFTPVAAFAQAAMDPSKMGGMSKDMTIERKQEFSLAGRPVGVYVIHVTSGGNSETQKIIKQ